MKYLGPITDDNDIATKKYVDDAVAGGGGGGGAVSGVKGNAENTYRTGNVNISPSDIGVEDGAQVNVQPDWDQSNSGADDYIKNKPSVPSASNTSPNMDGTAAVGTETAYARGDHRHPTDTTRAPINAPSFTGTANFGASIVAQGNITVGGHDSAIGSSGGTGTNSSQVALGTTTKAIASLALTKGVWILIGRVQVTHGSNATYAAFNISPTSAYGTAFDAQYYMNASYDLITEVVEVVSVTAASQTYYLNGKAGRSVNVAANKGTLTAWRLA